MTDFNVTVEESNTFDVTVEDGVNVNVTLGTVSIDLASIPDVTITDVTNQQVLKYDSSDSKWKNEDHNIVNLQSGKTFEIKDSNGFTIFKILANGDIEYYGEFIKK